MHQLYEEVRQYAAPINLQRCRCGLRELWCETWQNLSHCHEEKRLELREETQGVDLHVDADPFAIRQVFRNILENAIAASPANGEITVCAAAAESAGRPATSISFQDQGPGLTDEQRQHIFTAFFTTKAKGTGLGMAIAQRIVHSHGGRILAGNSAAGGAKIEVILPRD